MMDILVTVSDKTLWALDPFAWQFNKHWSPESQVLAAGFASPSHDLPDNFSFISLGRQEEFPAARWSDALSLALQHVRSNFVVLLLEDYWLTREVDLEAVDMLLGYMQDNPDVLRMDLTTDRLYANGIRDIGPLGRLDLIEGSSSSEYQISLQAGIWNVELLRRILKPGMSPWEFEVNGSDQIKDLPFRIVGTRQAPVRYLIAIKRGEFSLDGSWQYPPKHLEEKDIQELNEMGLLDFFKEPTDG
jgi:hypothetical protein